MPKKRKEKVERHCEECGSVFLTARGAKFCSSRCRAAAWMREHPRVDTPAAPASPDPRAVLREYWRTEKRKQRAKQKETTLQI